MAVKIRLLRMGKIRNPQYRIVVADSRTKRDGRAIEYIGLYHPKEDPSRIEVKSERAQYWLSVGAQPSEPVQRILEKTGDWQKFKGLPAPPPLLVAAAGQTAWRRTRPRRQAAAGVAAARDKPAAKAAKPPRRRRPPSPAGCRLADGGRGRCRDADRRPLSRPRTDPGRRMEAADAEVPAQTEESAGADAGTQA